MPCILEAFGVDSPHGCRKQRRIGTIENKLCRSVVLQNNANVFRTQQDSIFERDCDTGAFYSFVPEWMLPNRRVFLRRATPAWT